MQWQEAGSNRMCYSGYDSIYWDVQYCKHCNISSVHNISLHLCEQYTLTSCQILVEWKRNIWERKVTTHTYMHRYDKNTCPFAQIQEIIMSPPLISLIKQLVFSWVINTLNHQRCNRFLAVPNVDVNRTMNTFTCTLHVCVRVRFCMSCFAVTFKMRLQLLSFRLYGCLYVHVKEK